MEIQIVNFSKCETFSSIFQNLKVFTEMVNVQFDKDRMYIQGMNSAHVCLYDISISSEWFDLYNCEKSVNIGIHTIILFNILNTRDKTQKIKIDYNEDNCDKLNISFLDGTNKNEFDKLFETPLIDIIEDKLFIPEIEYQSEFSISSNKFATLIKQLKLFGDNMDIICSENGINLLSNNNCGSSMEVKINIDDVNEYSVDEGESIKVSYSLNYIENITAFHKLTDEIEVSIIKDKPIRFLYILDEHAVLKFYLAPKITDDDES